MVKRILNQRQYYASKRWWHEHLHPMHDELYQTILAFSPERVLEFGFGGGKNLAALEHHGVEGWGLDVNHEGVIHARLYYALNRVIEGDERALEVFREKVFGVAFTCSVLNHLPNGMEILGALKRIARNVVVCECVGGDFEGLGDPNWWVHPYAEAGLEMIAGPFVSDLWAGIPYGIWRTK